MWVLLLLFVHKTHNHTYIHVEYSLNTYCCTHAFMFRLHGTKPFWMRIKKHKQSFTRQLSFSQGEAYYYVILGKMSLFDGNNFLFIEMTVSSEPTGPADRSFKFIFVLKINFIKMHAIDETWTTHYTVENNFRLFCSVHSLFTSFFSAEQKAPWLIGVLNRCVYSDMVCGMVHVLRGSAIVYHMNLTKCNAFGIYHMRVCLFVHCIIRNGCAPHVLNQKRTERKIKELLFQLHFVFIHHTFIWVVGLVVFVCLLACFKSHFYLYSCLNYWAQIIFCCSILCHGKSAWMVCWSKPDIIRKIYCFSFKVYKTKKKKPHTHIGTGMLWESILWKVCREYKRRYNVCVLTSFEDIWNKIKSPS